LKAASSTAARPTRLPFAADALLAVAAGALHTVAYVHTGWWWLQIMSVAVLAWRVSLTTVARSAWLGMAFGTAWIAAATWWMFISMHRYGGLPGWMAALAVAALAAALSLYLAAALAVFARLRSGRPLADAALFAACWLLAELSRGILFTGFPWAASGYAHVDGPLGTLAPWIGVYGVGAVAAFCGALFGQLPAGLRAHGDPGRGRVTAACIGVVAVLVLLGWRGAEDFTRPAGALQVSLLQTNVPQEQKFEPEHLPLALEWLDAALAASSADLVVAPETAVPLLPEQLEPSYRQALAQRFQTGDRAALIGMPLGSFERGYTNSAVGLSRDSASLPEGVYRYDKHHLVPFGEFIPRGFRWFTELMNIPLGDFNGGPAVAPSFVVRGQRVAPNICYEDLFGEQLGARFGDPRGAPTMFANLSNIAWFGDTIAIEQHLNISRMRTLEFQRPMLRATNTGATAIVDHRGRVTHSIAPTTRGQVDGVVQGRDGLTPYAWWVSRAGLWPLVVLALAVVGGALWRRRGL
jgi:apolipoprotein N-acyltransferase